MRALRLAPPLLALAGALLAPHAWSTATPLPERLQEHHGALLRGQVYVAGGFDSTNAPTRVAYRLDPARGTWARIADLPEARHHMPLVVAHDTLYAVGGLSGTRFVAESNLWIFRPETNAWEARAPLPTPRGASAVGVVDGKLVVVGGFGPGRALVDSTAVYDPATNRWTAGAPIPTPRDHLTAEVVRGTLYAIAGRPIDPDRNYDVVESYDPATDRWTRRAPMPSRRGGLASATLGGAIHTFGGETHSAVFANHEVYDPAHDRWTVAAPMPTARHGLAALTVGDRIYVVGGGPKAGLAQARVVEVWR